MVAGGINAAPYLRHKELLPGMYEEHQQAEYDADDEDTAFISQASTTPRQGCMLGSSRSLCSSWQVAVVWPLPDACQECLSPGGQILLTAGCRLVCCNGHGFRVKHVTYWYRHDFTGGLGGVVWLLAML